MGSSQSRRELDPGSESRTFVAGPVAMVPSRVNPVPEGTSPARNFKLSVRLEVQAGGRRTPVTLTAFTGQAAAA
jgi:hypothetical protein